MCELSRSICTPYSRYRRPISADSDNYPIREGRGLLSSRSHTLDNSRSKRINTGASNIQADADRCKQTQQTQTVSLVNVTQSLDNNISPPKLIWSDQPRCWPRPID